MTDFISVWGSRLRIRRDGHAENAFKYAQRSKQIGIPTIVITAIVGSAVFGNLGTEGNVTLQITAGVLSLAATVLSSIQTFLDYDTVRNENKEAFDAYSGLLLKLETEISKSGEKPKEDFLEEFRQEWDLVKEKAPILPKSALRRLQTLEVN